ncbi:hypothetical protein GFL80_25535 [Rhizobium leguminosarum bv. viciae]|uniref:hypothetical protein n=1 Tax=Rhizobium leguminosarum TaxID=384 RepID=UPI0014421BCE|nr:hypothetical protein [Rhizobium leguminosarum]NKK87529.1 hypothetical protein [Rhizobium leguminosarum bv. viciae]
MKVEQTMAQSALARLLEVEKFTDEKMVTLGLWRGEAHSVLAQFLRMADSDFSGGRFGNWKKRNPDRGANILSRLSYLVPYIRNGILRPAPLLSEEHFRSSVAHMEDLKDAIIYAHFCEVMPEVRRFGHIISIEADRLEIRHKDRDFEAFEERDIVASELSIAFTSKRPEMNPRLATKVMLAWPTAQLRDVVALLKDPYLLYLDTVFEEELLPDAEYRNCFGFDRTTFIKVRAALMAIGFLCNQLATAAEARSLEVPKQKKKWANKALWWTAPLLNLDCVTAVLRQMTQCPTDEIDAVLSFFVEDLAGQSDLISGDGYLAPLFKFGEKLLIGSWSTLVMMTERNLLYISNKREQKHFNEVISQHLEPRLLEVAEEIFSTVPGTVTKKNVVWAKGEIDLLVFCADTNSAFQIQAKACIPAQGARMTRQVETNTLKAVEQLIAVEKLSQADRDGIINSAFNTRTADVRWSSGALSRSSFGTSNAWQAIGERAAINPSILRLLAREHNAWKGDLAALPKISNDIVDRLVKDTSGGWTRGLLSMFEFEIGIPLLNLDYEKTFTARQEIKAG